MFINKILLRFAKLTCRPILKSILIQTLIILLTSATALIIGQIVNHVLSFKHGIDSYSMKLIATVLLLTVLIAFMSVAKSKLIINAGIEIKSNVRSMLVQKMFLLGPGYVAQKRTGELVSIMTSRVEWLMNYYVLYLPAIVSAIINAGIFIVFLFYVDYLTGFTALISCIAMIVIPMFFFSIMRKRGIEEWNNHARYYSNCLDGIQGMISLKALGADNWYVQYVKTTGVDLRTAVMKHLKVTMLEGAFSEFFARVGSALTLAVLAIRLSMGSVGSELIILAFFATGAAFVPMLTLINAWHMGFQGVAAAYSIEDMLKADNIENLMGDILPKELLPHNELTEYINGNDGAKTNTDSATIEFDNVEFSYDTEDDFSLKNISFKIQPNKMLALVGSSGSGKTTIANLLEGFYKINSGNIRINGEILSEDNIDIIRGMITAVWQDSHLFDGTVYENIAIGKRNATKEDVKIAAQKAEIHEFISSLPYGYETEVGENGKLFSTGERQRIVMARAFLKDSPILIFDEATSALDRENEIKIQCNFNELRKGKTVLVIAHRLQTILEADEICILNKGAIVDRGTHGELSVNSELYKKIMGEQLNA